MGRRHWLHGQIEYNYGALLRDTDRLTEAETLRVRGYERVRDALGAESRRALTMVEGVAQLCERLGQADRAATYRRLLPASESESRE